MGREQRFIHLFFFFFLNVSGTSIAFAAALSADVSLNTELVIRLKHSEEARTAFKNYSIFGAGGKGGFSFKFIHLLFSYTPSAIPSRTPPLDLLTLLLSTSDLWGRSLDHLPWSFPCDSDTLTASWLLKELTPIMPWEAVLAREGIWLWLRGTLYRASAMSAALFRMIS